MTGLLQKTLKKGSKSHQHVYKNQNTTNGGLML